MVIRRSSVGLMPKYSPNPPHNPVNLRFEVERNNLFMSGTPFHWLSLGWLFKLTSVLHVFIVVGISVRQNGPATVLYPSPKTGKHSDLGRDEVEEA